MANQKNDKKNKPELRDLNAKKDAKGGATATWKSQ